MPGIFHWWPLYFWVAAVVAAAYSFVRTRNSVAMTYTGRDGGSWSIAYVAVMVAAAVTAASVLSGRGSSNHRTAQPAKTMVTKKTVHKTVKPKAVAKPQATTKTKASPKKQRAKPVVRTVSFVQLYPVHEGCGGIAFRPKPNYTGGHYQYKKGTVIRLTPKPCKGWQFARWSASVKGITAVRCKHQVCRFAIKRVRRARAVFTRKPVVHYVAPSAPTVVAAPQPATLARPVYSAPVTRSYTPAPSPDPAPAVRSTQPKPDPYPAKPKKKVPQKPAEVLLPPPPPVP